MPVGVELKDDATREDVDAMVKDVMEERKLLSIGGDGTGDAAEKDTSKQTHVDDDKKAVDADAVAVQKQDGSEDSPEKGEKYAKVEKEDQPQYWLTDDVRAELPQWISDEDLSEFSSRDELDRAIGLMDRAALKAGRDSGKSDDMDQRGQESAKEGKARKQQVREPADTSGPPEIDLDLSEFDEDLSKKVKGALTGLRDHYEGRMKALDERFAAIEADGQARAARAVEAQFDAVVDSLEHADLFGKSGEESDKQLEARRKLFDEHRVYLAGLKALGREGRMDKASVSRVLRMAFADHISKQEQKNLTKRITKQSNMRMGVGAERPSEQSFKGPLTRHPDIQRAYKQLREARDEE